MPNPILGLLAGGALGIGSSAIQAHAADKASDAQTDLGYAAIDEQKAAREQLMKLLSPYVAAGGPALQAQLDFLGLGSGGPNAAISQAENNPIFQALAKQGETAILQNASATGGVRGGNVQGALAEFRPQLLNQFLSDQWSRLGQITTLGQNSAAGVGSAGMSSANNISQILGDIGAAKAGGALAKGQAWAGALGGLGQLGGIFAGGVGGGF